MALFKKQMTATEIKRLIDELSDDEKDKLADMLTADLEDGELDGDGEDEKPETTTEQIEEAEVDAEEKGEKPTKAEIDESVGEQEYLDGDEDSQDADDRVDEAEGEDQAKVIDKEALVETLREILPDMVKAIIKEHNAEEAERDPEDNVDDKTKSELARIASIYNN